MRFSWVRLGWVREQGGKERRKEGREEGSLTEAAAIAGQEGFGGGGGGDAQRDIASCGISFDNLLEVTIAYITCAMTEY